MTPFEEKSSIGGKRLLTLADHGRKEEKRDPAYDQEGAGKKPSGRSEQLTVFWGAHLKGKKRVVCRGT